MPKLPFVSVLILNYNQNEYTLNCVNSILKSKYVNFNLFVLDNGSKIDNFQSLVIKLPPQKNLEIVRVEKNLGYVGGINEGLSRVAFGKPDYILVMNNDTLISDDSISELVTTAEKYKKRAIVSGKVYDYDQKNILQYIGQLKDFSGGIRHKPVIQGNGEIDRGQYDHEIEMGMLDDIFWLIPFELYLNIGGYSDFFYIYVEQNDFALRALKQGYKLIYTPKARIWHKGGVTTCNTNKESAKVKYWNILGSLKLAYLHLPPSKVRNYTFNFLIRQIVLVIFRVLKRQNDMSHLKAIFFAFSHYNHWKIIKYKDNGFNPFDSK